MTQSLPAEDLDDLRWAHAHLEHSSFAVRLSTVLGVPIEIGLQILPETWQRSLQQTLERTVQVMLDAAITSMGQPSRSGIQDGLHKVLAFAAGAVGGFFGPLALLAELPATTSLMLRSIADIARAQGEDLGTVEARLACLQVFALGGRSKEDEAADTGYYGLRAMLAFHFLDYAGDGGITVPATIGAARAIAARLGMVISDQMAARMIPIASAISGALVNLAFMQHYQDVARGHFTVRRLERKHGPEVVRLAYEELEREEEAKERQEYSPLEGW